MKRWLHPAGDSCSVTSSCSGQDGSGSASYDAGQHADNKRATLDIRLDNQAVIAAADQLAAAEAAIAAMYSAGIIESLTDSQLLSMAITADMLQLEATAQQALYCLRQRSDLSSDMQQHCWQFMALPAWPSAILPLFHSMGAGMPVSVVAEAWVRNCTQTYTDATSSNVPMKAEMQDLLLDQLGDLDAVWGQPDLVDELMSLPLPAMALLLSSSSIQVRLPVTSDFCNRLSVPLRGLSSRGSLNCGTGSTNVQT
jgi:hypothetical protein